jgi:hypothetical protein
MNMSNKSKTTQSKAASLLAALQQKPPVVAQIEPEPQQESAAPAADDAELGLKPAASTSRTTKSRAGKPVQFWIHEEDRRLLRELAAWLAGQGERPTDSMVIRCALRVTKTGAEFLKAYRDASQLDGRLKQHKSA